MVLEWNNIDQCSRFIDGYFFHPFYEKLSHIARENSMIPLASPAIGLVDGIASSIQAIGAVAEAAIKGIGNLIKGAIACDTSLLKTGSLQLILGVGVVGTLSIPIILFRTLRITGGMILHPQKTSETQEQNYRQKLQSFVQLHRAIHSKK